MGDFDDDLARSRSVPRSELRPFYLAKYGCDFKEEVISYQQYPAQQRRQQDFRHLLANGLTLCLEEKIREFTQGRFYGDILIELSHHYPTGEEKKGWFYELKLKMPFTILAYAKRYRGQVTSLDLVKSDVIKTLVLRRLESKPFKECACAIRAVGDPAFKSCDVCGSRWARTTRDGRLLWRTRNIAITPTEVKRLGGFDLGLDQRTLT